MPPDAQQPPAVVAHHPIGLGTGDRFEPMAGPAQGAQRLGQLLAAWRNVLATQAKVLLGLHDGLPLCLRQALSHLRCRIFQRQQVVGHAGHTGAVGQARDERAREHPARLQRRGRIGQDQGAVLRAAAEPVEQARAFAVFAVQAFERQLGQAYRVFGPLGVATQPVKVFAGSAADRAGATGLLWPLGGDGGCNSGQGFFGAALARAAEHPDVGAAAALLHRRDGLVAMGQPAQGAGQDPPGPRPVGQRKDPDQTRAQHHLARAPGGRLRQRQIGLYRVVLAALGDAPAQLGKFGCTQVAGDDRQPVAAGVGRLEHKLAQFGAHILQGRLLAAPPGGQRGQLQRLAQQVLAERRKKSQQGRRLQKSRARRVGHQHMAGAHDLQQTGHAQGGVGAQFQRI